MRFCALNSNSLLFCCCLPFLRSFDGPLLVAVPHSTARMGIWSQPKPIDKLIDMWLELVGHILEDLFIEKHSAMFWATCNCALFFSFLTFLHHVPNNDFPWHSAAQCFVHFAHLATICSKSAFSRSKACSRLMMDSTSPAPSFPPAAPWRAPRASMCFRARSICSACWNKASKTGRFWISSDLFVEILKELQNIFPEKKHRSGFWGKVGLEAMWDEHWSVSGCSSWE